MGIQTIKIGDREIQVDTSIADRILAANNAKVKATGTPILINEGFRTAERQADLFKRSQAGEIGRAAPPGHSFHETGKAVDISNVKESQSFLNSFGLNNDLSGDSGHFSFGETKSVSQKFTNFNARIDEARQKGKSDTDIVNSLIEKVPDLANALKQIRARFKEDKVIKDDRDLVNTLSVKYSGFMPTVESVEHKVPEAEKEKPGFLEKARGLGKDIVRGAISPVIKSFLAPGQAIVSAATGKTPTDLELPFFGDVTPPQTVRAGVGTALQTGLLGVGGGVAKGAKQALLKTAAKEAAVGAGFGLGVGLEEEMKGKELIVPTAIGAAVGAAAPFAVKGIGKGLGAVKKGVKAIPPVVEKAVVKAGKEVAEKGKVVTKFGVSQATGLAPETIEQIIKSPEKFTKELIETVDRESIAKGVLGKIDNRIKELKDTGKAYTAIRESGAEVGITPNFLQNTLKSKYGFDIIDGQITATTKSSTRSANDIKAIQDILDNWGNKTVIDADEFLNLRGDLSALSKFDATRTGESQKIARGLRAEFNEKFRGQIDGLEELDKLFSGETTVLNEIKKDFFKKDGSLKDNAISKLANLTGKGKEQALDRLKALVPDVEEQVGILRAIEDIEYASGRAVGTYARSIIGAGGIVTGNVPAIVASVVSTPKIAVQLLRRYAQFRIVKKELLEATIKSLQNGKKLLGEQAVLFGAMLKEKSEAFKKMFDSIKDDEAGFTKLPGKDPLAKEAKLGDKLPKLQTDPSTEQVNRLLKAYDETTDPFVLENIIEELEMIDPILANDLSRGKLFISSDKIPVNLAKEAKKFDTVGEFVDKNIDDYVKTTKEYKDWAKGSENIIEAYHGTPYSFDKFEIGKKQAGVYELDSISFATKKSNAEIFSRQYPDWYYDKKKVIDKKYTGIFDIKDRLEKIERQKKIRSVDKIKKEGQELADRVNAEWKKDKDWLYNGNYEKFKSRNTYSFGRIEELKLELKRAENVKEVKVSTAEKRKLTKYNKELQKLDVSVQGNTFKVYIKGKNIRDVKGEDVGFSSGRAQEVDEAGRGGILRIKDADTGQYIGEEIIVNDPSQVFIVNSPRNKSQLTDIFNQAKK